MSGNRGENIPAMERAAHGLAVEVRVVEMNRFPDGVARQHRCKQTIVGPDQPTPVGADRDRQPPAAYPGIDHADVDGPIREAIDHGVEHQRSGECVPWRHAVGHVHHRRAISKITPFIEAA